jgi:hypothetical protein
MSMTLGVRQILLVYHSRGRPRPNHHWLNGFQPDYGFPSPAPIGSNPRVCGQRPSQTEAKTQPVFILPVIDCEFSHCCAI